MMAPQLEYHGVGAVVSALMRFIHPSEHIWNKYPNPLPSQHLENCTTICQEVKNVSRRDQLTLIVHHKGFKHADGTFIELYAVKQHWKVHQSGHPDYLFDRVQPEQENEDETKDTPIPEGVDDHLNGEIHTTQTNMALVNVVDVDDSNERIPENIPQPNNAVLSPLKRNMGTQWFLLSMAAANMQNHKAKINFHIDNEDDALDALQGELDNVRFHIVSMKEPDYVMMIMTTYGSLVEFGEEEKRHYMVNGVKHVTTFRYPKVVYNHYHYHDVIDNHNSFRMHLLSMEETWMTMHWPNRVFLFPLGNHHGKCPEMQQPTS